MKVIIKKLATVQVGFSFRSRLEASLCGDVSVIQMKDLLDDNTVDCGHLMKIDMDDLKAHHIAQKGDLIFRSRGLVTTSAILRDDPGKAVVAAPLLRIRITAPDRLLPEYLNWYISQREAQVFLNSRAMGTVQQMITKQAIEELEVALPNLERQSQIVELSLLAAREQILACKLALRREQYISEMLIKYAKGE